ncbi:hypothetical protein M501DRAFT_973178 [Patellaria atrata CBS 101060]|uniref:Uncharacterized protein n=1 Tax=Patellaria atrata CBS 101060 TaxID=1346257 RepID=A0A9P4SDH8_9PEZI|nr:hypothetical protein M501DRAFT_973178 [Patellaria atrata CBS 101060]
MAVHPHLPPMAYSPNYYNNQEQLQGTYIITTDRETIYTPTKPLPASIRSPIPQSPFPASFRNSSQSHDSVISQQSNPKASYSPSAPSVASLGPSGHIGYDNNIRTSKHGSKRTSQNSPQRSTRDLEKGGPPEDSSNGMYRSGRHAVNADVTTISYGHDEPDDDLLEDKALRILIYLSSLCPLVSLATLFWTLISVIVTIFLQPLRLISYRPDFPQQLTYFLEKPLRLQLRLISSSPTFSSLDASMLFIIHLFSPLIAFGVAVASWTTAFFWFYAAIIGDPDGKDGHNDGRATVLGVRAWWERWLLRAMR